MTSENCIEKSAICQKCVLKSVLKRRRNMNEDKFAMKEIVVEKGSSVKCVKVYEWINNGLKIKL